MGYTGEKLCDCAEAMAEDVDAAVRAAKDAYDNGPWPRMTGYQRGRILERFADLVEEHGDELALLETLDNGKTYTQSKTIDVPGTVQHLRYFAGFCDKIEGKTIPCGTEGFTAYTLREPIGVAGQIIPWNFPILMAGWKIAPALAAGCTIVLKVSQYTPLTALKLGELALEAGVPPGVLNILTGKGSECGDAITTHNLIDKVAFTGSTDVGKTIMAGASKNIKPVTLELGGNSPIVVCDDCDLEDAVQGAHEALFFNMGQACECGARLFVQEGIYDQFVKKSIELAKKRKVGDPFDESVAQGPLVSEKQVDKVLHYIELGQKEGAKLGCGGKRWGDKGFYLEPTVFYDVKDDMAIARDEIFGPVQVIFKFSTIDEVIKRANDTEYGLAAAVWTKSLDRMQAVTRGAKAGTVWVNTHHIMDASVPFGGYKQSGFGREHGSAVLEHYTQTKSVVVPLPKSKEQRSWVIM
ncbi:aldehyde dehydrogenase [Chlorella sorokiniana]|uniref:Aldehyde dehydrogenase n=1 Tax=Chlorella sorokiniana TaxID=3076 RepID=A0A2P6TQL9_CHLSO|nr:aldehyde dehydrogenase [Chlorella sorokiniana]|eukprot:PRW56317.1 aldehyde dehydrogenase [Chlorella sorokiniana]